MFTIITICLNNLQGLQLTEKNVCSQTYDDFEWLVIDGNSEDGTREYLMALDYDFLRWWSEPDRGHFDAMNKGIELARGEYLLFLNAGDRLFNDDVLADTAKEVEGQDQYDWLIGDAVDLLQEGTSVYKGARPLGYIVHSLPSSHQAIFFHRDAIGDVRYDGEKYPISGDYAFAAQIYQAGHIQVKYVNFPVCIFSLGGISSQDRSRLLKDAWRIQRDILNISLPVRALSYVYRFISMFLLDYSTQTYRLLRTCVDRWSVPQKKQNNSR